MKLHSKRQAWDKRSLDCMVGSQWRGQGVPTSLAPPGSVIFRIDQCAHKKGEVVVPAGGETGGPRCLAEVRKLLKAALFHFLTHRLRKVTFPKQSVKQKIEIF